MGKVFKKISANLLALSLFAAPVIAQSAPSVEFSINNKNEISFNTNGQTYINEFGGKILKKGSKVIYSSNGTNTTIGRIKAEKLNICSKSYADVCKISFGQKNANSIHEQGESILTASLSLTSYDKQFGPIEEKYDLLEPYVVAAPNQQDAGTCLFMATTGAMEILLNKEKNVTGEFNNEGDTDLSERFLITSDVPEGTVKDWRTDQLYKFNALGGAMLNRDYRFTKGYYKKVDGELEITTSEDEEAQYGAYYNWIPEIPENYVELLVNVPTVDRNLIFVDPEHNQWNVGIMNDEVIVDIKTQLRETNSPVLVIYNHYGYWHAVLIVGYDDSKEHEPCPFVNGWTSNFAKKAEKLEASEDEKDQKKAKYYRKIVKKVKDQQALQSGCSKKGVFKVRDSIYTGSKDYIYDYDLKNEGEEAPYSRRIIEKSYEWMKYLGNHAYTIIKK